MSYEVDVLHAHKHESLLQAFSPSLTIFPHQYEVHTKSLLYLIVCVI